MRERYDFSGWATKNDLLCSDGRTIRRDAFKDNDGKTVPLVWQHQHNSPDNVLGHCLLENRPEGVYAYGVFNDTHMGQKSKALVEHGDITAMSIFANKLKQTPTKDVLHGDILEVSLVLSPANPGASIVFPIMAHGDEYEENFDEATIYTGEPLYLMHADDTEEKPAEEDQKKDNTQKTKTVKEIFDGMTEEQKNVVYFMIGQALEQAGAKPGDAKKEEKSETIEHADKPDEEGDKKMADTKEKTVKDVFNELTEEQKNVVYFMIGQALEDAGKTKKTTSKAADDEDDSDDEEAKHYDYGGETMKTNVFDNTQTRSADTLSHAEITAIFNEAQRSGSLRDTIMSKIEDGTLSHTVYNDNPDGTQGSAQTYGMANIGYLFPEAKTLNNTPTLITGNIDWVQKVMGRVHHSPFSRVRSVAANVTMDEARAKGYVKGTQKATEVFKLLKRVTEPQTVYKYQKIDRDDILDITDLDVVAFMKQEMRIKLDQELARAYLIGDGREITDDDKINEANIRPIASDDDLYTIKATVTAGTTDEDTAKNIRRAALTARTSYQGSGTPVLYAADKWVNELMLINDSLGHPLYETEQKLASALRVSEIVSVPDMDGKTVGGKELVGVIVNLNDYNVGADRGGAVSLFDDFDLEYNRNRFLIETRCSGALTKPYSAITLVVGTANPSTSLTDDEDDTNS